MREVAQAWQAAADTRQGLFDVSFDTQSWRNSTGVVDAQAQQGLLDAIACHHAWLGYLLECWQV